MTQQAHEGCASGQAQPAMRARQMDEPVVFALRDQVALPLLM
jgi:hypothetical protein